MVKYFWKWSTQHLIELTSCKGKETIHHLQVWLMFWDLNALDVLCSKMLAKSLKNWARTELLRYCQAVAMPSMSKCSRLTACASLMTMRLRKLRVSWRCGARPTRYYSLWLMSRLERQFWSMQLLQESELRCYSLHAMQVPRRLQWPHLTISWDSAKSRWAPTSQSITRQRVM